jgi:hypothetical protein
MSKRSFFSFGEWGRILTLDGAEKPTVIIIIGLPVSREGTLYQKPPVIDETACVTADGWFTEVGQFSVRGILLTFP